LKKFEGKVKEFAKGYQALKDNDGDFAVYESTLVGSVDPTCPPGKKYYGYGYVFKGTGDSAAAAGNGAVYCLDASTPSRTFIHEQAGHMFSRLEDEYVNTKINPNDYYSSRLQNCTVDPTCSKWDKKKDGCELGCLYAEYSYKVSDNSKIGFYRSSKTSLMQSRSSYDFNTLSLWIIHYKAANGYLPSSVNQNGQPSLNERFPPVKWP